MRWLLLIFTVNNGQLRQRFKLKDLHSEINTLSGYPKAALFGFCMALVSMLYAVVMAAIQASYPKKNIPVMKSRTTMLQKKSHLFITAWI